MRKTASPWIIWSTAEFFTLFQFLIQLTGGIIVQPLMEDFGVTAVGAAVLTSSFYYMYISLQIPVGIITDKVGPRRLLSMGALVCGIGCIVFSQTSNFYLALLARLFMGGGASFAFVGTLNIIREWFPLNRYAFLVGMSEMLGMFWAVLGTMIFAELFHTYGWRTCLFGSGIGFLLSGMASALLIKNHNPARKTIKSSQGVSIKLSHRLMIIMRSRTAWLNSIYSGLMFSVVTVFVALWGTPFLELALHISLSKAAMVGTMAFIGIALGCPLYGFMSQKYKKRKPLLIFSSITSALLMSIIIYSPHLSIMLMSVLMFLLGVCCSGYILCFAISDDIAAGKVKNTFAGFTNAVCMLTAPLLQPVVGYILDRGLTDHNGYSIHDYRCALSAIIISLLLATVLAWVMPETFKRR